MPPAPHAGEILAGHLAAAGISPPALARQVAVPPNRIAQILNARRAITADTALRPAHSSAPPPEFWLTLQSAHGLRLARVPAPPSPACRPAPPAGPSVPPQPPPSSPDSGTRV